MSNKEPTSELVNRLHSLRIRRGMTIQQMAEASGLPKSSLESYMRIEGARRPGVDALVSLANGLDVSIDWLVGRSNDSFSRSLTEKDYAISCFSAVLGVLNWLHEKQLDSAISIIETHSIAGVEDAEIAAKAMLTFVENISIYKDTAGEMGMHRSDLYNTIREALNKDGSEATKPSD